VRLIVADVAAKQASERGLTAEQISRKIAADPSALNIAEHLLKDAADREIERLLTEVVPDAYFSELEDVFGDAASLDRQAQLFRTAFDFAPDSIKKKAMNQHVKTLKHATGGRVEIYEQKFFRSSHLEWVSGDDQQLVREHLLSQLEDGDLAIYAAAKGIGAFLEQEDVKPFVDGLVRRAIRQKGTPEGNAAKSLLEEESNHTPSELDPEIASRIDAWIRAYQLRGDKAEPQVELLQELKAGYEIPF
jgi:hypothetical protein